MQIAMITYFGEMKFDMPPEKVADLMQRAFQYASGQEPQKIQANPQGHVECMFNDFNATGEEAASSSNHTHAAIIPDGQREMEGYKGFLLIKCGYCGKLHGFCAKTPITFSRCDCGHNTEFHDLRPASLVCKCGREFNYKTNITDERFEYHCFQCGSPVDLELNKHGTAYVTIN